MLKRLAWSILALPPTMFLCALGALAQDYPTKPVRFVISAPAGSPSDVWGRAMADRLAVHIKGAVIVENRPGASDLIAVSHVAKSEPDGHTLLWASSSLPEMPVLLKDFRIDILRDLLPVSQAMRNPLVFIVGAHAPYRTVDEFVSYMRANPGRINWAYASSAALPPLQMFRNAVRVDFLAVPYKGAPQNNAAVVVGDADIALTTSGIAKPLADGGKARILATLGTSRIALLPDVPALGESSHAELRELAKFNGFGTVWFGIVAPAKTPRGVIATLSSAAVRAARDPEFAHRITPLGSEPVGSSSEQFTSMIAAEIEQWKRIARAIGLQAH